MGPDHEKIESEWRMSVELLSRGWEARSGVNSASMHLLCALYAGSRELPHGMIYRLFWA